MRNNDTDGCMVIILIAFVVILCLFVAGFNAIECNAKTAQIGYPAKYDLMAGCLIEVRDGQWIPLDNYYFRE